MDFTYLSEIGAVMEILWVLGFCFAVVFGAIRYRHALKRGLGRYLKLTDVHPFGGHAYRGQAGLEIHRRDLKIAALRDECEKLRRKNGELEHRVRDLAGSRQVTIRYIAMAFILFIAGGFTYALVAQASKPYETRRSVSDEQRDEPSHAPVEQTPLPTPTMCREPEMLTFEIMTGAAVAKDAYRPTGYRFGVTSRLWGDDWYRPYWLDLTHDCPPSSLRITYATSGGENTKAELQLTSVSSDAAPILTLF